MIVLKQSTNTSLIDEEAVASDEELAQVIIKLINDIETPITLSSEQAILKAKAAYENATQSVKSLVINSNLLDTYYNEYLRLKAEKELTDYKNTKKNQLKNSVNLNDYSSANQAKITDIINETLNLIDSSTTTVEVDNNIIVNCFFSLIFGNFSIFKIFS